MEIPMDIITMKDLWKSMEYQNRSDKILPTFFSFSNSLIHESLFWGGFYG